MGEAAMVAKRARKLDISKILPELPEPPQPQPQPQNRSASSSSSSPNGEPKCRVTARLAQRVEGRKSQQAIFDLFERNMRTSYEGSSMGWNERSKRRELFHSSSRFILLETETEAETETGTGVQSGEKAQGVAVATPKELIGYCIFRFDTEGCEEDDPSARPQEDEVEVAYCYELQIAPSHRGQRLGAYLLDLLEILGRKAKMRKVMLTVFISNEGARRFYRQRGYQRDGISPREHQECDYEIMSKALV